MSRAALESLRVDCATPADEARALQLACAHLSGPAGEPRARAWNEAVAARQATLWVGYRGETSVAATLVQLEPGRTAMVLPGGAAAGQPRGTASELLSAVLGNLANQGVQLAQALLETDSGEDAQVLYGAGFHHAADLIYLVSLSGTFPSSPPCDGLEFLVCREEMHERLAGIVEQTYEGSLDCPQLDRARTIDNVLDGYRAVGEFDPARWLIVRSADADVGCLLLADHSRDNAWELVYMGVVPAVRGRSFGVAMVRHAQWLTGRARRERLTTAVDANNLPAIAAYAAAGFMAWDRRSVFLRTL